MNSGLRRSALADRRWRWPRRARSPRRSRPRSAGPTAMSRSSPVTTTGDKVQDRPLAEIGGKALWTKELDRALLAGEVDFCVHSMKDVESERPDGDPHRRDAPARRRPRPADRRGVDRRAARRARWSAPRRRGARRSCCGCGPTSRSCRCAAMSKRGSRRSRRARSMRPCSPRPGSNGSAIDVGTPIPIEIMLPAPGQAAIGIECRTDDTATQSVLTHGQQPDHLSTACMAERAFTRALGATCHSPVAAWRVLEDGELRMRAQIVQRGRQRDGRGARRVRLRRRRQSRRAGPRRCSARRPQSIRSLFDGRMRRAASSCAPSRARARPSSGRASMGLEPFAMPLFADRAGGLGGARSGELRRAAADQRQCRAPRRRRRSSKLRGLPVYAVGEATAEAARDAGLRRRRRPAMRGSSGCSARSSPTLRLLHLCGEDRHEPAAPASDHADHRLSRERVDAPDRSATAPRAGRR